MQSIAVHLASTGTDVRAGQLHSRQSMGIGFRACGSKPGSEGSVCARRGGVDTAGEPEEVSGAAAAELCNEAAGAPGLCRGGLPQSHL